MKGGVQTTFYLDRDSQKSSRVDRPFTSSQLVRFWLKVLWYSEDELVKMKKKDDEFRAIMLYCDDRVKMVFGKE